MVDFYVPAGFAYENLALLSVQNSLHVLRPPWCRLEEANAKELAAQRDEIERRNAREKTAVVEKLKRTRSEDRKRKGWRNNKATGVGIPEAIVSEATGGSRGGKKVESVGMLN